MIYSTEKFTNGSVIVFGHYSFGIIPLIMFPSQDDLGKFIMLLQSCQEKVEIPEVFKRAFNAETA